MKTFKTSDKASKIKLNLEDFQLDKIKNLSAISGGKGFAWCSTESVCTVGDEGCCDDFHIDDYAPCKD